MLMNVVAKNVAALTYFSTKLGTSFDKFGGVRYKSRGVQPGTKVHAADATNASTAPAVAPAMLWVNVMFISDRRH